MIEHIGTKGISFKQQVGCRGIWPAAGEKTIRQWKQMENRGRE
jgi:hypothetical protein